MATRFGHLEIFAADLVGCRGFYETLGFEHVVSQGPDFVWLKLGDQEILLRRRAIEAVDAEYGGAGPALIIYTDDVEGTVGRLESAGFRQAGCDRGEACCPLFRDPGGNWIQIVDPGEHH